MDAVKLFFSDFFDIDKEVIEEYGAVNISLINDLPLFIDPFLLFNSDDLILQDLHDEIIKYLQFLQRQAILHPVLTPGMMKAWYLFSEVKQNWLGFSMSGNSGSGLGPDFARNLHSGLNSIFKEFGNETITKSPHMEKLCLISSNVGRDKISDFTTNLTKKYLLEYTQSFAKKYLSNERCKTYCIGHVFFNYDTMTWQSQSFYLPNYQGDFVILTPKTFLTGEETFINRNDMIRNLENIAPSIGDEALRFQLNNYFSSVLRMSKKEITKAEKDQAAVALIRENPELIDYYIKHKEEKGQDAISLSEQMVQEVKQLFNIQLQELVTLLHENTSFYKTPLDSLVETKKRVNYLKTVIEDQDGYRIFYVNGKPIKRENDLQIMYRLVWYATELDVNREVNNGRGPVDYKVSYGSKNSTLVEFKLASNSKLKQNLSKQVEIYKIANGTEKAIKAIMYFSADEYEKVNKILNELKLHDCEEIILIDARNDNKPLY